jgi:hypothetical protein
MYYSQVSNQHQRKRACLLKELVRAIVSFTAIDRLYRSFRTVIKQCGTGSTSNAESELLHEKPIDLLYLWELTEKALLLLLYMGLY